MELAIRIGRAVVKDEFCFTDILVGDALIYIELLPASEHFWFPLREARLHGEFGEWQIKRFF